MGGMNYARLIPVCLISVLVGVLLPRVFIKPAHLTLAAAGYLLLMLVVDRLFGSKSAPEPLEPN